MSEAAPYPLFNALSSRAPLQLVYSDDFAALARNVCREADPPATCLSLPKLGIPSAMNLCGGFKVSQFESDVP